jgi:peptide/nickel transport system substrate-binding protein
MPSLVPAGGGSSPAFTATKILERLIRMERDLSFSPVLALSVTPSADFKVYTIKLRPDVKWHDGQDFTAEDVVFSAMDYWKPIAIGEAIKSLESATATDRLTVVFKFSTAMPEFALKSRLADWALVLPKHIYAGSNILINPANNLMVGTGPYKLKAWTRGSFVEYIKNERYWDSKLPYVDRLVIRWWRDPASRSAALETGELHIAAWNPIPVPDHARLMATGKFVVEKRGYENSAWVSTIEFNTRRPETAKPAVRRALMHAIDRQFIANTIYYGLAKPGVGPMVSYNTNFFTDDVPKYPFDPVQAGKLLDAAGYPVKADGWRFSLNVVAAAWFEENAKLGQYIKQDEWEQRWWDRDEEEALLGLHAAQLRACLRDAGGTPLSLII